MAVNIRQDGYFEVEYVGPYGGLNVQQPENLIKDTESPALSDVILRNEEIRSRPALNTAFISSPNTVAVINAIGMGSTASGNPNLWAATSQGVYRLNFGSGLWTLDNGPFQRIFPTNWRVFQNTVYAVNGTQHLASWDAKGAFTLDNANIAGPTTVGAQFIDELDNHLLMANTNEGGTFFPQRVRWSATGLPTVWDPTVNINAGLADFIEVPDQITGLMMLGRVGYIFRSDGITEIAPTGRGQAPFDFNHLWASQFGIGNQLFFAIAQWGTTGFFASRDNIYMVQSFALQPIGGNARDAILKDIGNSDQSAPVLGAVVPTIDYLYPSTSLLSTPGATPTPTNPYLVYYLMIKLGSNTKVWVYSVEDNNWTNFTLPGFSVTGRPTIIASQTGGLQTPIVAFPLVNIGNSNSSIGIFNAQNFNDSAQGSSYSYKVEDIIPNRVPTVRRVAITYRDLGIATITLTLTGTNDNQTVQSVTSPAITLGNTVPTNALMVKLVDLELSAFRPQLSWNRAANGGPVSIVRMTMMGNVERDTTL